jgi:hypothetical protein
LVMGWWCVFSCSLLVCLSVWAGFLLCDGLWRCDYRHITKEERGYISTPRAGCGEKSGTGGARGFRSRLSSPLELALDPPLRRACHWFEPGCGRLMLLIVLPSPVSILGCVQSFSRRPQQVRATPRNPCSGMEAKGEVGPEVRCFVFDPDIVLSVAMAF